MISFSSLLSHTYVLGWGINKYYNLPFSAEISAIGLCFTGERVLGWINSYLYKKLTEKQMIWTRELMIFGSNLAIFYLMATVSHKSNIIANFYESKNEGILALNILTFLWRFQSNISYYRRITGLVLSSMGFMTFGILDSIVQRNRSLVQNFISQIETSLNNGATFGIYYRGTELVLYPPQQRQQIMPITQEEIDNLAPLRCAGLDNVKTDDEINKDFERPESCIICLEEFKEKELHRTLPCLHTFHASCIDPWLLKSAGLCPICKKKVKVN